MNIIARTSANLAPRSQEYFRTTREVIFGAPLEQLGKEEYWVTLEANLGKLDAWLSANGTGQDELLLGDKVCFSDVQVAALFIWTRIVCGEDSADWKRIAGWHGGKWKRIVEYFDKYAAVDM